MAISIKEPCNEDWTKMTPTEKGAFCQACALDVVDFTNKTPIEIKVMLAQEFSSNSRTCGRITNHQLDQINDEFFQWKSETEAFKAVWLFSMIAVFGLTLFSCQNTHTKELVNQLQIDTTEMLATIDTTVSPAMRDIGTVQDSIQKTDFPGTIAENPWGEVYYQGTIAPDLRIYDFDITTCTVVLGNFIVSGAIEIPENEEKKYKEFLTSTLLTPFLNVQETKPVSPLIPVSPVLARTPLEAVLSSGNKVFDSFVYPNPVDETSRVFINSQMFLDLTISLFMKGIENPFRNGQASLPIGHHKLDLKLHTFEKGEYQLKLENVLQVSILDFKIV
ncbi:MAG: hypothetical protein ACSHXL_06560 [Bacteroidota bacterium]